MHICSLSVCIEKICRFFLVWKDLHCLVVSLFQSAALLTTVGLNTETEKAADLSSSHRVGPQRDSASAAGAELGLAVGAQVAAAVGKLGLMADAAGGCVVPVDGGAGRHRCLPDHCLPVAGQLLLDPSVDRRTGRGHNVQNQDLQGDHRIKLQRGQY